MYAHASLHHIFQLEHLLDQIKQTLKPGGLFVVYEYIGPSQMQFPRRHLELADIFLKLFRSVTASCKRGGIKKEAFRASLDRMNSSDPSEGIRASEIVPLIASRFEIKHFRYVGGTLLLLVFNEIAGNFHEKESRNYTTDRCANRCWTISSLIMPSFRLITFTWFARKRKIRYRCKLDNVLPH